MSNTTNTWNATGNNFQDATYYYQMGLDAAYSGSGYMQYDGGENITIPSQYQSDYDQGYGNGEANQSQT